MSAPLCPRCKGGGVIDTSPPGVEHVAPWLQTDTDCPDCDGTGLRLETTHACPPEGSVLMPCCGRTPLEVAGADRLTLEPDLVTCKGIRPRPETRPAPAPPEIVALGEAVNRLTEAIKDAARRDLATIARAAQRLRERLTR